MTNPIHGGRREGAGRPPLPKEEKMVQFLTSFPPELMQAIREAAQDNGMKVAEFIRHCVLKELRGF